jgi:glycolate oxidase FAD binding subunit
MMDSIEQIQDAVVAAKHDNRQLAIVGGGTKSFYGREIIGEPLQLSGYSGIIEYQPTELVITAKAGTSIESINRLLGSNNQKLGFEPPVFGPTSTLGGVISAGLSGPSRPYSGGVQDYVLGIKLLSGSGEVMRFGGQVIKNVAGFDVSRLMVGAMGCLGVVLEVSLKVVPIPESERTVRIAQPNISDAVSMMNALAGRPVPVTAAAWFEGVSRIRLSGSEKGVQSAVDSVCGEFPQSEVDNNEDSFWHGLQNLTHSFFDNENTLYRASVKPSTVALYDDQSSLVDWGGAMRWYCPWGEDQAKNTDFKNTIDQVVVKAGGHLGIFRNGDRSLEVMAPVSPPIMKLQKKLKAMFDPDRILNPGRLYREL